MTKVQRIKEEIQTLKPAQKSELMEYLVRSETTDFHPSVKSAWVKEIKRRDAELRSGTMKTISHEELMVKLRRRHR